MRHTLLVGLCAASLFGTALAQSNSLAFDILSRVSGYSVCQPAAQYELRLSDAIFVPDSR